MAVLLFIFHFSLSTRHFSLSTSAFRPPTAKLSQLSDTLGQWQAAPNDARLCERAQLQLDNTKAIVAATPVLADLVSQLEQMRASAASCNVSQLLASVPDLFAAVSDRIGLGLDIDLSIALSPNSLVTEPNVATTANVIVKSRGVAFY